MLNLDEENIFNYNEYIQHSQKIKIYCYVIVNVNLSLDFKSSFLPLTKLIPLFFRAMTIEQKNEKRRKVLVLVLILAQKNEKRRKVLVLVLILRQKNEKRRIVLVLILVLILEQKNEKRRKVLVRQKSLIKINIFNILRKSKSMIM